MKALYAVYSLLPCISLAFAEDNDVSVNTNAGTFIGTSKEVEVDGKTVHVNIFLGIPFAEPPVGDLRFRKPEPKAVLEEPLLTQKYGPECTQVKLLPLAGPTSEDCLYLNVFAPNSAKDAAEKKAVMIWIYGGAFITGSANMYVSDTLAATGDVIVVTLNYRISAMGFLNVGDSNAPGNYGLWDQHLAIKWVHDNIEAFGGDNKRVTIFGESAGAGSVIHQGLYPGNKGLFQRIISQSGTAASLWAITQNATEETKALATLVGCKRDNKKELMECLRNIPADTIEAELNGETLMQEPFPFLPSVDGDFVKVLPNDIFDTETDIGEAERATLASFDLMIGANYAEGSVYVSPYAGVDDDPHQFLPSREFFEKSLVPICIERHYGKDTPSLLNDLVIAEYTNWSDPESPVTIRDQFVAMHGDADFIAPLHATLDLYLKKPQNDLFVYHFTADLYRHIDEYTPVWIKKPGHGDDLVFVFGDRAMFIEGDPGEDMTSQEKELAKSFITMWTNFAKTGNPNKPRDVGIDWLPYTSEHHRYLDIAESINQSSMKERFGERRSNLWNRVLPKVFKSSRSKSSKYDQTCEKPDDCSP